jgi:hypothetical protein
MSKENQTELTLGELVSKILEILPDAIIAEDQGEIVISTGLTEITSGDVLTPVESLDSAKAAHYFTDDGTYGSVDGMEILDTTNWTPEDWDRIDEAGDSARLAEAKAIAVLRTKKL